MMNLLLGYIRYGYGYGNAWGIEYTMVMFALLGVMILGLVIQTRLNSNFKKYSKVQSRAGKSAEQVARQLLYAKDCDTQLTRVSGSLTDHFNPKTNTVGLSDTVYDSSSVAALAVAAHEIGHVLQHKEGYAPIKIRNAVLPVANIGSMFAPIIVIVGLFMSSFNLAMVGVCLYAAVLAFQIITLPVEFDASSRAIRMLTEGGYIERDEVGGAKKVLRMAAMTYIVSALATLLSLLRLMLIANSSRRR